MRMTKTLLAVTVFFILLGAGSLPARASGNVLAERSKGKPDAPIVVKEYSSLTCSHCGDFFIKTLPELEKKYVETGKVRFVFLDFPLNGIDLKASAVAHCMPKDQYFPFVSTLYKNIEQWALAENPEQTLIQFAKLGGLDEEKAKACIKNTKMLDTFVAQRSEASQKYDIKATPTFVINDGKEKLEGARELKDFTAVFDKLLAEKK